MLVRLSRGAHGLPPEATTLPSQRMVNSHEEQQKHDNNPGQGLGSTTTTTSQLHDEGIREDQSRSQQPPIRELS